MNSDKYKETEIGMIPEDWEIKSLDNISLVLTDGSHFSPKEYVSGDKVIATVKDMRYNCFAFNDCKKISDEDFNNLVKNGCSPRHGDILISKDGANCLDIIFVYTQDREIVLLSSIAIVRLKEGYNPFFYRYYLLSQVAQNIMRDGYISGSAIPRVVLKDFKKIPVPIPPFKMQSAIAKILSDLDAKIELNQQMNKTLESISKSLFKQWFIDFEFQNEEGKPYKSSGGEMVFNEELEKEIPKGWKVKPIDEIADFLNGLALQKYPVKNEEECLPVIKIRELRQGITDTSDKASINIPKQYIVQDGDVLFSWSGSLEVVLWSYGKGALNQHLFKVTSSTYPKWLYYYWITQYLPEYRQIAEGKATTMGHIQRHHLKDSLVCVPNNNTLLKMDKIFNPIIQEIVLVNVESQSFSQLRDSLLPKLMSGKIRVPVEVTQ